jgi:preprotein translocase, secA subunit
MLIEKALRAGEKTAAKKIWKQVEAINSLEPIYKAMTDDELRAQTEEFRQRLADGENIDHLVPEAFAVVREATRRVLGKRQYDVQLFGGITLHQGMIAEAKTGSGKTIMALAPAYLNALTGQNVHVVTTNDYLAATQQEQMGRVYSFLGLTSGVILNTMGPDARRENYAKDITYGTNNEFGFDYLRDNMVYSAEDKVQRGHYFVIVDEVDSILIDEARTPLIISGAPNGPQPTMWFEAFAHIAEKFVNGEHYEADYRKQTISALDPAFDMVEDWFGINNMFDAKNSFLVGYLNNAIKAKELFRKDKDYIVTTNKDTGNLEVAIVDEHTGRVLAGRRYNDGLHQALEAKEKVTIQPENVTKATITLQNYFRLYDKLAGMTGTAMTEAAEFYSTYKLVVTPVPDNKPNIRIDQPDDVYRDEKDKFAAVVKETLARHKTGQPVLIGTASVKKSEHLSALLKEAGIPHQVLNAKGTESEALTIADAGKLGAVTVSTNMAGRGTDIILGGNPEVIVEHQLRLEGIHPDTDKELYDRLYQQRLEHQQQITDTEGDKVRETGGLYVIGTEKHDSRRIDNQLRGRAGRQGDPGESKFYVSLDDEIVRRFGAKTVGMLAQVIPEGETVGSKFLTRSVESAQRGVEGAYSEIRKNTLKYDDVLTRQRESFYRDREQILDYTEEDLESMIQKFITTTVTNTVEETLNPQGEFWEDWDVPELIKTLKSQVYEPTITEEDLTEHFGDTATVTVAQMVNEFVQDALAVWEERAEASKLVYSVLRSVTLRVMDDEWSEHLMSLDMLKAGIGLRAYAQRDPLVEYQREAADFFNDLMGIIKNRVVLEMLGEGTRRVGGVDPAVVAQGRDFLARVG